MNRSRYRPLYLALAALVVVWLAAWGGMRLAAHSRMTAAKFTAFADGLDLRLLSPEQRARALRDLADKLNRLPMEERRLVRMGHKPDRLFQQMTEEEKGSFIEATMPTGFKQMIASFEQLPQDKRKRAVENALKRLRSQRDMDGAQGEIPERPPPLSDDLQKRIVAVGLKTFYRESSAQTKAEVAPLLEELQRTMEGGRLFRER